MKRELFTVEGNTWQKKAFVEQTTKELGLKVWAYGFEGEGLYLCPYKHFKHNKEDKAEIGFIPRKADINYNLSTQWQEAIEAFRDYYKEELVAGRWYKTDSGFLFKFERRKDRNFYYSVAINLKGEWREKDYCQPISDGFKPATKEEIQTALEKLILKDLEDE